MRDGDQAKPSTEAVTKTLPARDFWEAVDLATETEIGALFRDSIRGPVSPVRGCHGLDSIVDDSTDRQAELYLEAGDHETLIRLSHDACAKLTAGARRSLQHACIDEYRSHGQAAIIIAPSLHLTSENRRRIAMMPASQVANLPEGPSGRMGSLHRS